VSATVAAALKKIAVALLTNPKVLKTVLGIVLGIIIIIIMPIVAIVSIFNGSIEIDTTKACIEISVSSDGGIPSDKRKQLLKFNFNDNLDDLTALADVPVDTFAISSQYLMFGKSHGWAYRACTDAEKNNPLQSEVYPMTKLYCADGDLVREIAE